jgi:endonuclease YncB( thermonuclease family)
VPDRHHLTFAQKVLAVSIVLGCTAAVAWNAKPLTTLQPYSCQPPLVIDGDTLTTTCGWMLKDVAIRVANIDAPEMAACPAQAQAAADHLHALTAGGFTATPLYTDRYGRTVATLTDPAGTDIATAMVTSGHAAPWPHDTRGRALTPRPGGCR